jgi:predicted nucleotide-binding protein
MIRPLELVKGNCIRDGFKRLAKYEDMKRKVNNASKRHHDMNIMASLPSKVSIFTVFDVNKITQTVLVKERKRNFSPKELQI